MARETYQEPTERATPKRREEARQEGKVARSGELVSALVLLAGVLALSSLGGAMLRNLTQLIQAGLAGLSSHSLSAGSVISLFQRLSVEMLFLLLPLLLTLVAVGLTSNILQVGFLLTLRPLNPRWSVLNPFEGLRRMFSLRSLTELLKAVLKVALIAGVAYLTVSSDLRQIVPLEGATGGALLTRVGAATVRLGLRVGFALLLLAVLDYGYQRWEYERSLRMSRQEIEEEQKQTEGDPRVKTRIRILQRLLARRRMMQEVPKADVVIVNPTHVAVALRYERARMAAPVVVARGLRKLAEKIKAVAQEHSIPIVEDPPLARLLYKEARLGQPIPVSLYKAVAQVLAHVWRLQRRTA